MQETPATVEKQTNNGAALVNELIKLVVQEVKQLLQAPDVISLIQQCIGGLTVSDINQKTLTRLANKQGNLTQEEVEALTYIMGKGEGNLDPYSGGDEEWSDDMVQEYADNLRNFLYTYKDSATNVDPSIDPNEYHRGPMAQDIEKVAPDCVKETSQGVKVVDGNRLALVNAGVIGDLARRVIELEDKLNADGYSRWQP